MHLAFCPAEVYRFHYYNHMTDNTVYAGFSRTSRVRTFPFPSFPVLCLRNNKAPFEVNTFSRIFKKARTDFRLKLLSKGPQLFCLPQWYDKNVLWFDKVM